MTAERQNTSTALSAPSNHTPLYLPLPRWLQSSPVNSKESIEGIITIWSAIWFLTALVFSVFGFVFSWFWLERLFFVWVNFLVFLLLLFLLLCSVVFLQELDYFQFLYRSLILNLSLILGWGHQRKRFTQVLICCFILSLHLFLFQLVFYMCTDHLALIFCCVVIFRLYRCCSNHPFLGRSAFLLPVKAHPHINTGMSFLHY